jgi:hypothetical protein
MADDNNSYLKQFLEETIKEWEWDDEVQYDEEGNYYFINTVYLINFH